MLKPLDETNFKQTAQHSINGNHSGYGIPSAIDHTNSGHVNATASMATASSMGGPDMSLDTDCVPHFWNPTISSADYSYQPFQQQSQPATNNGPPAMLCDSQSAADEANREIFVRSDSILTDDDYVPFEMPSGGTAGGSKFGPISRMSAKTSSSYGQVNANKTTEDHGILSAAPSSFFNDNVSPIDNITISTENLGAVNSLTSAAAQQAAGTIGDQSNAWLNNLSRSPDPNANLYANGLTSFKSSMYGNTANMSPESMLPNDGEWVFCISDQFQ